MAYIEWKDLPRKTVSAAGIFFNAQGKFIVTKPNYKEGWNLPGGMVDGEESPREAFTREVEEELGLKKSPKRLLCVDYVKMSHSGHDHVSFIFDGGVLTNEEIKNIKLQKEELVEYRFVDLEESFPLLWENWRKRIPSCIKAWKEGTLLYLENGAEIEGSAK